MLTPWDKAIAAFIGSLLPILANLGLELSWLTPQITATLSVVLATLLTYLIPNKEA